MKTKIEVIEKEEPSWFEDALDRIEKGLEPFG